MLVSHIRGHAVLKPMKILRSSSDTIRSVKFNFILIKKNMVANLQNYYNTKIVMAILVAITALIRFSK